MAELDERIKQAEARLKQLRAQKQQAEARKRAAESKRLRAEDTRRKILVGAAILGKVERGDWPRDRLRNLMDETLTRLDDRKLFDLDAREEDEKTNEPVSTPSKDPSPRPSMAELLGQASEVAT